MSQQLGIWHPYDGHQDNGYKEEQGTSTAIKEEWHDAENVNTQETTMRRDASDAEEAALDEKSIATRGSLRDSESLEDSETEDFSQTVGLFEEVLEQADRAEPRQRIRARNVPQFFGEVRTHLAVTEGDYVEPKTVYEAKQGEDWDQWHQAMKDETPRQRDLEPSETTHRQGRHTGQMGLQSEIGIQWSSGQIQSTLCGEVAKSLKQVEGLDYFETFAPTCKPETFRILLQLSAKQSLVMHPFDVKTAFLHSPKEEMCIWNSHRSFTDRINHIMV